MKRLVVPGVIVCAVLLAAYAGITVYDENLRFGRMWETPAVRPHEIPLAPMEPGSIPVDGGEAKFRSDKENRFGDPNPDRSLKRIFEGKKAYTWYCVHCHGKTLDGQGPVGQSFSPLPTDLKNPRVQALTDGMLFQHISQGNERSPALASTMSVAERWSVIVYLRAAAADPKITADH